MEKIVSLLKNQENNTSQNSRKGKVRAKKGNYVKWNSTGKED